MAVSAKGEGLSLWISLIKEDKIGEVLREVQDKHLSEQHALSCVKALSHLAYCEVRKETQCKSSADDILRLTIYLCSFISSDEKTTLRYMTSVYHVVRFFYERNDHEKTMSLMKVVVQYKIDNPDAYRDATSTIHECYISLLKNSINKMVSLESSIDVFKIGAMFEILLELQAEGKTVHNTLSFLQILQLVAGRACNLDYKSGVHLINTVLKNFYKIGKAQDKASCLPVLFKIYEKLFDSQLNVSSLRIALAVVEPHLNKGKRMFSGTETFSDCFLLSDNTVKLISGGDQETLLSKILTNCCILKSFENICNDPCVSNACTFVLSLVIGLHKKKHASSVPVIPGSCVQPFQEMILSLFSVFKGSESRNTDSLQCLSEMFNLFTHSSQNYDSEVLKKGVSLIMEAQKHTLELLKVFRDTSHKDAETLTKITLVRFANLIRVYHIAGLKEVATIAKPVCQFICSLPTSLLQDPSIVQAVDLSFTCLVNGLGVECLDQVLECIVAWLIRCPRPAVQKKAFKLWGDLKHNAVFYNTTDHLNTTFCTIVREKQSTFESEWLPCQLTDAELGNFLLRELMSYYVNKSLRGMPVVVAYNALQSLSTDCLVQARGLVIALEVTSGSETFSKEKLAYYNKSKALITKLRKQKKMFEAVEFNSCLGDLLYAQLRCQLTFLRSDCESEVVRLSIRPHQPLIAELPESRPDPNDTCDVATKFNNLSLRKQRDLMSVMDSVLQHWEITYSLLSETASTDQDLTVTLASLQDAGYLMKLYCEETRLNKVLRLLYNMATIAKDINVIVAAVGEMLITDEELNQEWLDYALDQLCNPGLTEKCKRAFLLNIAEYDLLTKQITKGLDTLRGLEPDARKNTIHFTQFLTTIGEYQKLSNWSKYNHEFSCSLSYHFSFHKALSHLLFMVEESKWSSFSEACQIQLNMSQVARLLGEANWSLYQPREARCYLKAVLPVTQKLALPLRTVQVLLLLAWVDLDTGAVDDCAVKLEGLEDMLELCNTPVIYNRPDASPPHSTSRTVLSTPEYLSHSYSCQCLPCSMVEYRRLVLETLTLRAAFCTAFGRRADGLQCFEVARQVQEKLSGCKKVEVRQTCARLWLRFGSALTTSHKYQEAVDANARALQVLQGLDDPNILSRALEQKYILHSYLHPIQIKPFSPKIVIKIEKTPEKVQPLHSLMTPKNSLAKGKSPLCVRDDNSTSITPFARPVRPFKLPTSGDENSPTSVPKTIKKPLPPKSVTKTPGMMSNSTRRTKTPFVIVDDDGNAVGVFGSKTATKIKKNVRTDGKIKDLTKKKLFTCDDFTASTNSELETPSGGNTSIVRISRRRNEVRTYSAAKSNQPKVEKLDPIEAAKQKDVETKLNGSDDVFTFEEMKDIVDNIDSVNSKVPKKKSANKTLAGLAVKNRASKSDSCPDFSSRPGNKTESSTVSDDCDIVEGTPPEPAKKTLVLRRPRRANHSNKV